MKATILFLAALLSLGFAAPARNDPDEPQHPLLEFYCFDDDA